MQIERINPHRKIIDQYAVTDDKGWRYKVSFYSTDEVDCSCGHILCPHINQVVDWMIKNPV